MKKRLAILGAFSFAFVILASCGGGNASNDGDEKISLPDPPNDIKYEGVQLVDGPLSGFIEVVPGQYLLELDKSEDKYLLGYDGKMKVKFRFLKSIEVKAGTGYNHYGPSLLGKALDEQGAPLEFNLDLSADKDLATYLKRGSGEEWLTVTISGQGSCSNADDAAKQLDKYIKGKKIRFNSEIVEEKFDDDETPSQTTVSETPAIGNSSTTGNCKEFLDGYEKFMNDYLAIAKKMKNSPGDMSVISDYTRITAEAAGWADKKPNCSDSEFLTRFASIQAKIASAASGL